MKRKIELVPFFRPAIPTLWPPTVPEQMQAIAAPFNGKGKCKARLLGLLTTLARLGRAHEVEVRRECV